MVGLLSTSCNKGLCFFGYVAEEEKAWFAAEEERRARVTNNMVCALVQLVLRDSVSLHAVSARIQGRCCVLASQLSCHFPGEPRYRSF